jgi:nucleotide sugar dehydrogenase
MDLAADSLTNTALRAQSWSDIPSQFSTDLTDLPGYASSTDSARSDIDSLESSSSSLESPFDDTPLETPVTELQEPLLQITSNDLPVVAVLGVGYVGLHLVEAFSRHYKVIAFDVSQKRLDVVGEDLKDNSSVYLTSNPSDLRNATHFLVAVPTPLYPHTTTINTSIIQSALKTVCDHVRPGATVVIESSVSVGMTRHLLSEMVKTHLIYAGMSPERVDPGRVDPPYESIPKIISGLDDVGPGSLKSVKRLYSRVFRNIVPVSSPEVAEMTKLYENCQRMVCIAYANEMADACQALDMPIDAFEVARAAATKPFGYLPFIPSAGVGGDCIPVNPNYLLSTSAFPVLEQASQRMRERPGMLADRLMKTLSLKGADVMTPVPNVPKRKILVVGVAFKPGQSLTTNAPGVAIIKRLLDEWDAHVTFCDPLVTEQALPFVPRLDDSAEWNAKHLGEFEAIIVVIKQSGLDFGVLDDVRDGVLVVKYCQ